MIGDVPHHGDAGAGQDERLYPRYECRLEARLIFDGAWWLCWIRDISLGGAGVEPAIPPALGKLVELHSPSFPFDRPLRGRVVNLAHRRTCIVFDLDQTSQDQLAAFLRANAGPD